MAILSFNSQVLSSFGETPTNLSWSLTGANNTVHLISVGTGPTTSQELSAKQVKGIAFNALTSPTSGTGLKVSLSASGGTFFNVDRAYNNSTFSVIFTDRSSALFTCLTATATQTLTANNADSITPETRRLVQLGYI